MEVAPDFQRFEALARVDWRDLKSDRAGAMAALCFLIRYKRCSIDPKLLDTSTLLSSSE
jgi:hypothetical protein